MKIRISLAEEGEWSDCWLQTEYLGKGDCTFQSFIYPTSWSELYKTDGFSQYGWYTKNAPIKLRPFVYESIEHLKPKQEQNDRHLTKMQKACNFFKRLFAW
jgi:hypothetical protein